MIKAVTNLLPCTPDRTFSEKIKGRPHPFYAPLGLLFLLYTSDHQNKPY